MTELPDHIHALHLLYTMCSTAWWAFNVNLFNFYYEWVLIDVNRSLIRLLEDLEKKSLGQGSEKLIAMCRAGQGSCIVFNVGKYLNTFS